MAQFLSGFETAAALVIFVATYLGIALGRLPYLRIDRAGIALVGASLMVGVGAISLDQAFKAIDLNVIALLFGMMALIAHLRISGFFRLASAAVVRWVGSPFALLCVVVGITGFFSAFLVNDAVCLIMAPLVIHVTRLLKRDATPYLLATATASNAGSAATITGNPQNMIIGLDAHFAYRDFALRLGPPALVALGLTVVVIAIIYRREMAQSFVAPIGEAKPRWHVGQVSKALAVSCGVIVAFFFGVPMAEAAIIGASLLFVTRAVKSRKIYSAIDGGLLLLFAGLFVVTAAAQRHLLTAQVLAAVGALHLENAWSLAAVTAVLSNLVSNVPAVLVLRPFIEQLPHAENAWRIVAMSSTFAGNFTLLGSVANLIVAERARNEGLTISFLDYAKVGVPLTLVSLAVGTWWLSHG